MNLRAASARGGYTGYLTHPPRLNGRGGVALLSSLARFSSVVRYSNNFVIYPPRFRRTRHTSLCSPLLFAELDKRGLKRSAELANSDDEVVIMRYTRDSTGGDSGAKAGGAVTLPHVPPRSTGDSSDSTYSESSARRGRRSKAVRQKAPAQRSRPTSEAERRKRAAELTGYNPVDTGSHVEGSIVSSRPDAKMIAELPRSSGTSSSRRRSKSGDRPPPTAAGASPGGKRASAEQTQPVVKLEDRRALAEEGNVMVTKAQKDLRSRLAPTEVTGVERTLQESKGEGVGVIASAVGPRVSDEARAALTRAMAGEDRIKRYFDPTARSFTR